MHLIRKNNFILILIITDALKGVSFEVAEVLPWTAWLVSIETVDWCWDEAADDCLADDDEEEMILCDAEQDDDLEAAAAAAALLILITFSSALIFDSDLANSRSLLSNRDL